ncbi:universal stress protein [Brevundimonas sp.]|uniref:universal stress protein n=1 Tax=Brevundimonas sp. TaxID=1871086 RepID=UPI0025EC83B8|nr:universal stress protein [Brevundimonas sp.]
MSYKSILVLALGRHDEPAIHAGAWLAAEHDAVAHVLPVYPDLAADFAATATAFGGAAPPGAFDAAAEIAEENQSRIDAACFAAAAGADIVLGAGEESPRLISHPYERRVWASLERACVLADLAVVSGEILGKEHERTVQFVEEVLMRQRLPLLIARGSPDQLSGRAVIAWNGRIEAARAVRAALPLLGGCSDIDIVGHGDNGDPARPSMDQLSDFLKLHGVGSADILALAGDDPATAILTACQTKQAGLLVAGAYGHSRLREFVLGGVTRALLEAEDGPSLLLAH